MATDIVQRLREAAVTIVGGLATVQALCDRTTECCVAWSAVAEVARPVVAYTIPLLEQVGEDRDARDGTIRFTAIAEGNDADKTVQELLEAIEQGLTATALYNAGVDGAPMHFTRFMDDDADQGDGDGARMQTRNVYVAHLDVSLTTTT